MSPTPDGVPRGFVLALGVPLWLAALAAVGALLAWAGMTDHWVFFWIFLVAEIYAAVAAVVVVAKRKSAR
jgi:glycerol uptake facilitator-like aquaporin